jgi:hypothetical protein
MSELENIEEQRGIIDHLLRLNTLEARMEYILKLDVKFHFFQNYSIDQLIQLKAALSFEIASLRMAYNSAGTFTPYFYLLF